MDMPDSPPPLHPPLLPSPLPWSWILEEIIDIKDLETSVLKEITTYITNIEKEDCSGLRRRVALRYLEEVLASGKIDARAIPLVTALIKSDSGYRTARKTIASNDDLLLRVQTEAVLTHLREKKENGLRDWEKFMESLNYIFPEGGSEKRRTEQRKELLMLLESQDHEQACIKTFERHSLKSLRHDLFQFVTLEKRRLGQTFLERVTVDVLGGHYPLACVLPSQQWGLQSLAAHKELWDGASSIKNVSGVLKGFDSKEGKCAENYASVSMKNTEAGDKISEVPSSILKQFVEDACEWQSRLAQSKPPLVEVDKSLQGINGVTCVGLPSQRQMQDGSNSNSSPAVECSRDSEQRKSVGSDDTTIMLVDYSNDSDDSEVRNSTKKCNGDAEIDQGLDTVNLRTVGRAPGEALDVSWEQHITTELINQGEEQHGKRTGNVEFDKGIVHTTNCADKLSTVNTVDVGMLRKESYKSRDGPAGGLRERDECGKAATSKSPLKKALETSNDKPKHKEHRADSQKRKFLDSGILKSKKLRGSPISIPEKLEDFRKQKLSTRTEIKDGEQSLARNSEQKSLDVADDAVEISLLKKDQFENGNQEEKDVLGRAVDKDYLVKETIVEVQGNAEDFLDTYMNGLEFLDIGDDGHEELCHKCGKPGTLVCCDGCPLAVHTDCLGTHLGQVLTEKEWLCPVCVHKKAIETVARAKQVVQETKQRLVDFAITISQHRHPDISDGDYSKSHSRMADSRLQKQISQAIQDNGDTGKDKDAVEVELEVNGGQLEHRNGYEPPIIHCDIGADVSSMRETFATANERQLSGEHANDGDGHDGDLEEDIEGTKTDDCFQRKEPDQNAKARPFRYRPAKRGNRIIPGLRRKNLPWSKLEVDTLKEGVKRFSNGDGSWGFQWSHILEFGYGKFHASRTCVDLKDKWRNLSKSKL